MTLVQKLVDVCCETVCLREELALITPQRDLGADLVGKCCRVDLPRQDAPRETELILRCLLCAKKLRRDIRWLLDILHSERRELRPGMVSLEYARQLLFIHTFISYLDWTVKPIEHRLTQIQATGALELFQQMQKSSADLQWHITQLNDILRTIDLGMLRGNPQPSSPHSVPAGSAAEKERDSFKLCSNARHPEC